MLEFCDFVVDLGVDLMVDLVVDLVIDLMVDLVVVFCRLFQETIKVFGDPCFGVSIVIMVNLT